METFTASFKSIVPKGSFRQPNVKNPVKVTITNITEYGLVSIVYNQKLHVDDKYILVVYEQLSAETTINCDWRLLNSFNESLQIQLNFSRPLAVSVGK